jgi:hypothetical protein
MTRIIDARQEESRRTGIMRMTRMISKHKIMLGRRKRGE